LLSLICAQQESSWGILRNDQVATNEMALLSTVRDRLRVSVLPSFIPTQASTEGNYFSVSVLPSLIPTQASAMGGSHNRPSSTSAQLALFSDFSLEQTTVGHERQRDASNTVPQERS